MKLTTSSAVPVYTIAGEGTARPLPEWIARKRKRSLKKDSEYASRVELLQDFEFEEASQCVRVSEDGEWVVSTGTYKPQIHVHYLPHLSLSYARHTNTVNQTFVLLSSDYTKSLHLQTDRFLEFHTPSGLHYTTRIPRYGRDLKFNRRTVEALVPSVGVNADGNGEVFRLNLEIGRFMKGFEVDVGGDDFESLGGGALQGGIRVGSVNCAAVAEESHGLLAFGTSLGTVELWDSRSRNRISALGPQISTSPLDTGLSTRPEITALDFHPSGLNLATGDSNGIIHTYDLRSPAPLLRKDQGYGSAIQTLKYLTPSARSSSSVSPDKLLSADRKSIKLFDLQTTKLWTSIEPAVDLNCVEWVPDSGMLLTANEGRQQHAFLIPQLGPAPKWCSFLDNLVEEMAEDASTDPAGYNSTSRNTVGEVYDNYKFVSGSELRDLNLDHLLLDSNKSSILRPYMHGYFVQQGLYEQARLLANPDLVMQQRQKSIQEKIEKERESRIRGSKRLTVKVNRKLAEKLTAREEANDRRKAERLLRRGGDRDVPEKKESEPVQTPSLKKATTDIMADDRFKRLFEDEDFEIDEESREFKLHNPSSAPGGELKKMGITAVEAEEMEERRGSSNEDESSEDEDAQAEAAALRARQRHKRSDGEDEESRGRIGSASYKKSGHQNQRKLKMEKDKQQKTGPRMLISSSNPVNTNRPRERAERSFGDLASSLSSRDQSAGRVRAGKSTEVVGEKEISFVPSKVSKKRPQTDGGEGGRVDLRGGGKEKRESKDKKERRSASGNVFRRM